MLNWVHLPLSNYIKHKFILKMYKLFSLFFTDICSYFGGILWSLRNCNCVFMKVYVYILIILVELFCFHIWIVYKYICFVVCLLSCIQLFCNPMNRICQAPLSMRFPRQEHWSWLPFSSPGDLPNPKIKPVSPAVQADSLSLSLTGNPIYLP